MLLIGVCSGVASAYVDTFDGLDSVLGTVRAAADNILGAAFAGVEGIIG